MPSYGRYWSFGSPVREVGRTVGKPKAKNRSRSKQARASRKRNRKSA